jgi:hypothetical protein
MNMTTRNPDDETPERAPEGKMAILSSQHNLNLRVNMLLGVMNTAGRFLCDPEESQSSDDFGNTFIATAKARECAQETFGYACAALNVLLADRKIWDCQTEADAVKRELDELAHLNLRNGQARLRVVEHHARPSMLFNARLGVLDGRFVAYVGAIRGYGRSAEEALDNLDEILKGNTTLDSGETSPSSDLDEGGAETGSESDSQ